MYYAHSRNRLGKRHDLVEHLRTVAEQAGQFASTFGAGDLARYLGLWHDLGKFNPAFQEYLFACEANPDRRVRGPDHKAAGADLTLQHHLGLLSLLVQAHHGGLKTPTDFRTWLNKKKQDPAVEDALRRAREEMPDLEPAQAPALPTHLTGSALAAEMWLRMLLSALVDADRLDTEAHFKAEKSALRGSSTGVEDLWKRFERYQEEHTGQGAEAVARVRREVYEACLAAAKEQPGLFRLTVPTGGGKTRSAMGFALRHALEHGLRRVVVAVPYISITEQTAQVYRDIFPSGDGDAAQPVVLEHHSAADRDEGDEEGGLSPSQVWRRLAAENWDAPVIVTTTVQLFESLFASGTSPTRKLHRLAGSVLILDEAQALPAHLLTPALDALQELCSHYGTTVVISTATQPAFDEIPVFAAVPAQEIVPDPARHFETLKRVSYDWRIEPALSWPDVAALMREQPQALAVLNTKKDALALLDALDDPDALHLSTLLCGAHRRAVIKEVDRRLKAGEPCRLASTQVIEAGVDLDFPLVLRAMGPLDSIIQAAGRCNREGKLGPGGGRVIVFRPEEGSLPPGAYKTAAGITGALLGRGDLGPDDPARSREYFQRLFDTVSTDRENIQKLREGLDYPEVSRRFRMIDDDTVSVVVEYGTKVQQEEVQSLLGQLRRDASAARTVLRGLQPYLVSVRSKEAEGHRRRGFITEVAPDMPGLGVWGGKYDCKVRGLVVGDRDVDSFVV